jgi:hypothetical protein
VKLIPGNGGLPYKIGVMRWGNFYEYQTMAGLRPDGVFRGGLYDGTTCENG